MQKSDSIKNIAKALTLFHMKVEKIKRDAVNPFFHNKYASLSNILNAIDTPLAESGLSFSQIPTGQNGLTTILMHSESGEYLMGEYEMTPTKNDPQGKGSVITYQRRYALGAILGLNVDEDDDGNSGSQPTKEPRGNASSNSLPWLNEGTKEFKGAVDKLKAGTTTIEKIKTVMRLSKATETKLLQAAKS